MSLKIAQKLNIIKSKFEIDMDYNEDKRFFSNKLVPVAKDGQIHLVLKSILNLTDKLQPQQLIIFRNNFPLILFNILSC